MTRSVIRKFNDDRNLNKRAAAVEVVHIGPKETCNDFSHMTADHYHLIQMRAILRLSARVFGRLEENDA